MGIQLRYEIDKNEQLKQFSHGVLSFEILGESLNRDLIPGPSFHVQKQYRALASDCALYEVYVYYYSKFENGKRFAVVDALRPATNT